MFNLRLIFSEKKKIWISEISLKILSEAYLVVSWTSFSSPNWRSVNHLQFKKNEQLEILRDWLGSQGQKCWVFMNLDWLLQKLRWKSRGVKLNLRFFYNDKIEWIENIFQEISMIKWIEIQLFHWLSKQWSENLAQIRQGETLDRDKRNIWIKISHSQTNWKTVFNESIMNERIN